MITHISSDPPPGATTSAILRCTNWGAFHTYTHKPGDDDDVDYSNTTLRGGNFRFLLLILGPTGSGKTAITKYLKRYAALINNVGVRDGDPWVVDSVSYDHIIQREAPAYRHDFNQIMQQARDARLAPEAPPPSGAPRAVRQQQLGALLHRPTVSEAIYNNPDHVQNLYTAYQRARIGELPPGVGGDGRISRNKYISQRRRVGFIANESRKNKIRKKKTRVGASTMQKADQIVYSNLRNSIRDGKNIIFESTGKSLRTPKKIFDTLVTATNTCQTFRYIVLAAVNFINADVNRNRIIQRFKAQMRLYIQDRATALVPRLPNPAPATIAANNAAIYQNITDLIALCNPPPKTVGQCPGVGIDLLFIFDQNNHDWTVGDENVGRVAQEIYPIAVIPLSKRSVYITKYTERYNVQYKDIDRTRVDKLFAGNADPADSRGEDPIIVGQREKSAQIPGWRRRQERHARVKQMLIRTGQKRKGGRKFGRRKKSTRRKRRRSRRKKKTRRRRRKHSH